TDDTIPSPLMATHVKSPSVVLELPITWTETGLQDLSLGETGCNPSSPVCVGATAYADGAIGVYSARVEVCLAKSDQPKLKEVKDKDDKPIKCTTADGVLGKDGYWYDVADEPWSYTTLTGRGVLSYVATTKDAPKAQLWYLPQPVGQETKGTFSIPVDLPVPVSSLRVEIELGLKNPHAKTDAKTKEWVYSDPIPSDPY